MHGVGLAVKGSAWRKSMKSHEFVDKRGIRPSALRGLGDSVLKLYRGIRLNGGYSKIAELKCIFLYRNGGYSGSTDTNGSECMSVLIDATTWTGRGLERHTETMKAKVLERRGVMS